MDRRTLILALGATLVATGPTRAQNPGAHIPVALIQSLMASYVGDNPTAPPYTPAVTNRLRTAELDEDFIVGGQDIDVKNVNVTEIGTGEDWAEVEARFLSFGKPRKVWFDFRVIDFRWMIANVRDQNGFDLRRRLKLQPL
jgi:hypothetical protein